MAVVAATVGTARAGDATAAPADPPTLPRFVSLKFDRVDLRQGPGTDYPAAWVFQRVGMPVEVIGEVADWRQVRDADGTTGWVLGVMLSGRRTALVEPWQLKTDPARRAPTAMRVADRDSAAAVAHAEAGVLANVATCDGQWCRVSIGKVRGFIEQAKLWGIAPGEIVK